jgi:hypothetical protein
MLVRGAIATERYAACLTRSEMDPVATDLDAFRAFEPAWAFHRRDRGNVIANLVRHRVSLHAF